MALTIVGAVLAFVIVSIVAIVIPFTLGDSKSKKYCKSANYKRSENATVATQDINGRIKVVVDNTRYAGSSRSQPFTDYSNPFDLTFALEIMEALYDLLEEAGVIIGDYEDCNKLGLLFGFSYCHAIAGSEGFEHSDEGGYFSEAFRRKIMSDIQEMGSAKPKHPPTRKTPFDFEVMKQVLVESHAEIGRKGASIDDAESCGLLGETIGHVYFNAINDHVDDD